MFSKKRITAMALAAVMGAAAMVPAVPAWAAAWSQVNGIYQMPDGSSINGVIERGIDVSHWKQTIDWNAVAANDVQFVMLGTRYKGDVDPYFRFNAENAHKAGIKLGAYVYSYATNTDMANEEADFILNLIKDYPISYPVAFDVEANVQSTLPPAELSAIINTFCKRIEDAGYYPMLYANDYWLANKIDMSLVNYDVWVARYEKKHAYNSPAMWQATSSGSIPGVNGNVDINFLYKDFSQLIPANRWKTILGNTYYYKDFTMQKNTWIDDGDGWYYMDENGLAKKGWFEKDGAHYYLDETTGRMATGWKQLGDKWYYLADNGAMATGWTDVGDSRYYLNSDGTMATGWKQLDQKNYYLADNGAMATGWKQLDGKWYYLGDQGVMATGWQRVGDDSYYLNSDGTMATGWKQLDDKYYYLKDSGAMATGWRQIDNSWYYFNSAGDMARGWIHPDGSWYYLNNDGTMVSGWHTDQTGSYYMSTSSGKMTIGWRQVDDAWYYFNGSGQMQTGLIDVNGVNYYMDPGSGKMAVNTSVTVNGVVYDVDGNGVCLQAPPAATDAAGQPENAGESAPAGPGGAPAETSAPPAETASPTGEVGPGV